jgi:two-component system sensor histidine kinase RegB
MQHRARRHAIRLGREQRLPTWARSPPRRANSPLGTISVVARELGRGIPASSPWAEDVKLLRNQAERCREILSRLSQQGADENTIAQRLPLAALIDEIAEPHRGFGVDVNVQTSGTGALVVVRTPEVVHGIGNLIENAVDFANTRVDIDAVWSDDKVDMTISDDGTGFNAEILARLGEPYVTSRAGLDSNRKEGAPANLHADGHAGMGLGFFIAKTLIERIGGQISFGNKPKGGAIVRMSLPRKNLESPANSRG